MPSPFPGMDPYLERSLVWRDFHQSFLPYLRAELTRVMNPRFVAQLELAVFVHEEEARSSRIGVVDIGLLEDTALWTSDEPAATAVLAPVVCQVPLVTDTEKHGFIEIRDQDDGTVVTVIELLGPSNKRPGRDREQYLAKRDQILASSTHLVEIDWLRAFPRMPMTGLPACPYCVMVSRAEQRPDVKVWPIQLADRLPSIEIPLVESISDVTIDLQKIFDEVYETAPYRRTIYRHAPGPPLSPAAAKWSRELLRAAGIARE